MNSVNSKSSKNKKKKGKQSVKKDDHEKKSTHVSSESDIPSNSKSNEGLIHIEKVKEKISQFDVNDEPRNTSNDPFMRNCKIDTNERSKHSNDAPKAEASLKPEKNVTLELEEALEIYNNRIYNRKDMEYKNVEEIDADLFALSNEYHLGHCVAEDFNMGSGIALQFRKQFKEVGSLLNQRVRQGGLAVLELEGRYIYYLVTKRESNGKPTLETMFKSVYKMKTHIVKNNVKKLALPRIGCGLDRLEWSDVKKMLEFVFSDTECKITICNFQKAPESMAEAQSNHKSRKCKIDNRTDDIKNIENYTIIMYLGSEDMQVTPQINMLNSRFNIMQNYKSSPRMGTNVLTNSRNGTHLIYGCIVKKNQRDLVDYIRLAQCISAINKENQRLKERYYYVAMIKESDDRDYLQMTKVVNLMRNIFYDVDIILYPNPCISKGNKRKREVGTRFLPRHQSSFKRQKHITDFFK